MRKADRYAWRVIAVAMLVSALALACLATSAKAQRFAVVATCGTLTQATPAVGSAGIVTMDQNGVLCTSATGGGGGGAVTVADGADVAQGTTTDAACATDNGTCTELALLKRANQRLTTLLTNLGTANANGQAAMASSSPVVLANNQTAADPCMFQAKSNFAISTSSGTLALVTGVSAKKIYVCSIALIGDTPAVKVSLIEGSSNVCGTSNTGAVMGSLTAANGMSLAVNGGLTLGNAGGSVALTATAANYLCLLQSGTSLLAGNLTYVQQ